MMFTRPILVFCILASVLGTHDASAQRAFEQALSTAKSVKCTFPLHVRGDWSSGVPKVENSTEVLTLEFHDINIDEGSAQSSGYFGPKHDIVVRHTDMALHFVQSFSAGPLYTTTVFGRESRNGRLRAVHTRHDYMDAVSVGRTSRPEQYYGDCEVGK